MRLTWAQPEDLVAHELVQRADEGDDVRAVAERWAAAGGDPVPPVSGAGAVAAPPPLRALARTLLDELDARGPVPSDDEPDGWDAVLATLPSAPALPAPGDEDERRDRLTGAWTGRAVGCLLGKPVEKIPRAGIEEILRAAGRWPLDRYFTARGLPDDVAARWPWNRRSAPTSLEEVIDGMPEDDDLNYPLLALDLLEERGRGFTAEDVGTLWLDRLPAGRVFTAERAAYRNLLDARPVPTTATHRNPFREWIGALIRADVLGWVHPGDVRAAAALAHEDARLSHTRNGVYGAQWAAALCAAALVLDDVDDVLDAAAAVVPPRSRLTEAIATGRAVAASTPDRSAALDALHERYGHHHWVHVLPNAATIAWALASGRGDLTASISAAVTAGWDTDSVGATVGSVVGALRGTAGIDAHWSAPLHGRVATSLPGAPVRRIDGLVARTLRLQAVPGAAGVAADDAGASRGGRVVVVGSANVDLVVPVPRQPGGGETVLGGALVEHPGGKGANQAVAAARAGGARTAFVGAVGRDDAGELLLASLTGAGVLTDAVARSRTRTGTALITVDAAGENAIVVAPGANGDLRLGAEARRVLADADVVLAQLEVPLDVVAEAARSRRPGAFLVLNAAPSRDLPDELLRVVDVLVVNEHEARDLLAGAASRLPDEGTDGPERLAESLLTAVPAVVVTLGGRGSLVARRGQGTVAVPAPAVEVVDTTGAGDTFCGVLAAGLARGEDLVAAARAATVAGALAVTRAGAQPGVPRAGEVAAVLAGVGA